MLGDTYGHSPLKNMFEMRDVYGIAYAEERAARKKVRLGIIGAGGVAQSKHLPAIMRLRTIWEPVEVVAVADPNEQQGKKVAGLYGCQWYRDFQEMLKQENLDGIEVLSPSHLHYEHAYASLQHQLPVMVEKPLTRSLRHSAELCRYAETKNLPLMTVANKRWSPPYRRAKAIVTGSNFGSPVLWAGKFNLGYPYVDLLEEGTIHLLDLARCFMGNVAAVNAMEAQSSKGDPSSVENVIISLRFASGAIGSLHTSKTALSLKPWERVEIYGIGKWLAVEDQRDLLFYNQEEGPTQSWSPTVPNTLLLDEEFGGYMGEIENFLQVIRGEEKPGVTGWDGHHAYELVVATHLSLQTGETVKLPLDAAVERGSSSPE